MPGDTQRKPRKYSRRAEIKVADVSAEIRPEHLPNTDQSHLAGIHFFFRVSECTELCSSALFGVPYSSDPYVEKVEEIWALLIERGYT